jgi:hypothetical protein
VIAHPLTSGHGRKFVGSYARIWPGMRCVVCVEAVQVGVGVVAGVRPVERCCGLVVAVEAREAFGELVEVGEVVGLMAFRRRIEK